jgi:dsRNA-specific ribonuclease
MLTDDAAMKIYGCAFTSEGVDPEHNYQVLEQVGDLSGNKFIVNYMYERFPQLDCVEGVKVVARLRINYGAKESFSEIARNLGFWEFISATNDLRQRKMKPLLEDVFEAFLGATERIVDKRKRVGVGYAIVHDILTSIFDDMDISLRYEDLYDSKTRLKELFDMHETSIGPLVYKEHKREMITISCAFRVQGGKYEEKIDPVTRVVSINKKKIVGGTYFKIGEGSASLKSDAQQKAASVALDTLNKQGWFKPVPSIYKKFNKSEYKNTVEIISLETVNNKWLDVNSLYNTKEKNKYQSKYQSTPISMYFRTRCVSGVKACLSAGADPNIKDSDGMYPIDLLLIGNTDECIVKELMSLVINKYEINISKQVFDGYFGLYNDCYFKTIIDKLIIV